MSSASSPIALRSSASSGRCSPSSTTSGRLVLRKRDEQHCRICIENLLCAVPVVNIPVDNCDSPQPEPTLCLTGCDRDPVEQTKAHPDLAGCVVPERPPPLQALSGRFGDLGRVRCVFCEGQTVNVPLPAGAGGAGYEFALRRPRGADRAPVRASLVLISAGQDPAASDPLGRMSVTTEGLRSLASRSRGSPRRLRRAPCRLPGGGYSLSHTPFCTLAISRQESSPVAGRP
jgi:Histone deacetylase domain